MGGCRFACTETEFGICVFLCAWDLGCRYDVVDMSKIDLSMELAWIVTRAGDVYMRVSAERAESAEKS